MTQVAVYYQAVLDAVNVDGTYKGAQCSLTAAHVYEHNAKVDGYYIVKHDGRAIFIFNSFGQAFDAFCDYNTREA